jgi:hypothetical protein
MVHMCGRGGGGGGGADARAAWQWVSNWGRVCLCGVAGWRVQQQCATLRADASEWLDGDCVAISTAGGLQANVSCSAGGLPLLGLHLLLHTCCSQNLGVHQQDVRHGEEGGNASPQLQLYGGASLLYVEEPAARTTGSAAAPARPRVANQNIPIYSCAEPHRACCASGRRAGRE